jgi:cytochrome c peroxidase
MKNCIALFFVAVILLQACERDHDEELKATPLVVSTPSWVDPMPIPADNPLTIEGVALGSRLFYENQLSGDNSMSCASCHIQVLGFSDSSRFSKGITGKLGNRQAMTIINLAWETAFFWDGRAASLEKQAHDPVVNPIEMNAKWPEVVGKLQNNPIYPPLFKKAFGTREIDSILVTKAIAQFERTIVSFNSRFDHFSFHHDTTVLTQSEKRGHDVYMNNACFHCHAGAQLTDNSFRNNGLSLDPADIGLAAISGKSEDFGKFKTTSLRNIEYTAPYMHDGRFATLEEVVDHYNSGFSFGISNLDPFLRSAVGVGMGLDKQQKADLVAFMKTFSDESMLRNPAYSKPN